MYNVNLSSFTDLLSDEITDSQESQPLSFASEKSEASAFCENETQIISRPAKGTGQYDKFRSIDEIDVKYRSVFSYPYFNLVQSSVIEDALYSDKSMVVCAPTGSGKTVVFEMAIVQLLMELEDKKYTDDFKIIYMAPVKALCTERLTEWYPKFTKLGLLCIEVTGDTDVDFSQLKPYRIIITTPEKWDMVTRRWREHSHLVEVIKLFLIDEVHILNDETRGPVLEAVVSRMKTIEASAKSVHRIQQLQKQYQGAKTTCKETAPKIRFVAVSATVSNPGDVATWLGTADKPAVFYKFGDESRPVKLKRVVEGYTCPEGTSIFKFDIILNYKLWPVIQKYHNGKPTLIFCNTRKSVTLTAEVLSRELTVSISPEQKAKLMALASTIKNKKLQMLVLSGVGCHHAGMLYEERNNIEHAFRNRDLPILITTTTLAMGVNLPAHLVIIKNTQQYVKGAYQEYSISTILQMVGRAGRPQFDTEATAVIMTRLCDKSRYQALVEGSEPLQSYLHKRLAENLNSEAALGTVNDVAQCVQWVRSTFLNVRAARDPKRYLGLPQAAPQQLISKKIEELCVKAMNGLASSGLITMDEACCIESTEAGRLMSVFYLDLETMKHIMKINGTETLERLLWIICESHELADMHLRVDERRCLNMLNRNQAATTIRFPMKGKISTRQMKLNCIIQAILGCLNIPDPSLNQEAMKIMRIALRVCKCLVAYVTQPVLISEQPNFYSAVLNAVILAKCIAANLWENSPYVSKQLKGIGPTFSTLLASAGKNSFMLLEESHPRDLERIMNKGPPAGNVLRKQVGLLPKYQLTMTPIDEKSVTIHLSLLNRNHLSENAELTAGDTHKSYMIVGDSENNLLLLTSFMDKDLMGVYDGVITHQVTRKHSFEHNIFVHCISSSFVGIDVQCAYLFKSLEAVHPSALLNPNENCLRKPATKQTNITDTFKERKRKNMSENIGQSREKKKRENVLLEKFKSLKESFGKTSREIKENLNKSGVISNRILQEFTHLESPSTSTETMSVYSNKEDSIEPSINNPNYSLIPNTNRDLMYNEENSELNDEKINNILIEIENEISKSNKEIDLPRVDLNVDKNTQSVPSPCTSVESYTPDRNKNKCIKVTFNNAKKHSQKNNKSNYDFIELLNKNMNLSDEEDELENNKASMFSDTIKNQIDKYLQHTKTNLMVSNKLMTDLLIDSEQNKNTLGGSYAIGSKVNDFSENEAVNVGDEINALQKKCNINFVTTEGKNINKITNIAMNNEEMEHMNYSQNKTNHSQSHVFKGDQIVADTISNHCVVKTPSHSIHLNRNLAEKSTQNKMSSPLNQVNDRKRDDNVPKDNLAKRNPSPLALHTNYYEENRTAIFQQPSTMQYHLCKSPEIHETQKQIICHSNTASCRSEANPERGESEPEQYTANNISENNSSYNDSPTPYNQRSNIRKYSYSATKVDIATRENRIAVIRKIKMDVDITEIIGKKGSENNRHQDIKNSENNDEQNYTSNLLMKRIGFEDHEPHVEDEENNNSALALNRPQNINNNKQNLKRIHIHNSETKCIDYAMQEPYSQYETNKAAMAYDNRDTAYNEGDICTQPKDKDNFVSPKHITLPSKLSPKNKQVEHKTSNFDIKDDDDDVDKPSNTNVQNKTDRLGSIFQKYSKILRKNNDGHLSQTPSQPNAINASCNNTMSQKPKRPFKISEIHHLKTPLSRLQLTPTSDNLSETNDTTPIRDNFEAQTYIKRNKEFIQTHKQPYDITEQQEMWQHFSQNILDSTPNEEIEDINDDVEELSQFELQDSEIEELEPTKSNFKLEQSMLNPKTVLQCFNTDETDVLMPPPPEFSDEVELTPPDVTVPMVSYEPMPLDDFQDSNLIESIFQDDFNIELTPTKEIETWLLPQDDDRDQNLKASASSHSRQSFTIMHTPKQCSSPFQNVSVSRLTKLRQFKFRGKKKLVP